MTPIDDASVDEREKARLRVQSANAGLTAQWDEGDEVGQRLAAEHLGDALAEYRRQVVTDGDQ